MQNDHVLAVKPAAYPGTRTSSSVPSPPLRPSHVWLVPTKLQIDGKKRDLALFNLAIDSKLRGCDVVALRIVDVAPSGYSMDRTPAKPNPSRSLPGHNLSRGIAITG